LSVYGILLLQRKPKLDRTKPPTGPHAARGLDIAALGKHNCLKWSWQVQNALPSHLTSTSVMA